MPLSPLLAAATKTASAPQAPESPSILRKIAGSVLSPLAMAGNVLDLPGSSLRDVATGNNPFDQWLTPTQGDNRVSGRDVLTAYGITKPNDPHRWELADVGGFATEVAMDPLTLVSGLASGAGKALRGTGKASHLFKVAGQPIGKGAAQGLDSLAKRAWDTDAGKYLSRTGTGLFDYTARGAFEPIQQAFNKKATEAVERAAPIGREMAFNNLKSVNPVRDEFMKDYGAKLTAAGQDPERAFQQVWQHSLELASQKHQMSGRSFGDAFHKAMLDVLNESPSPALKAATEAPLKLWSDTAFQLNNEAAKRGVKTGWLSDVIGHAHRIGGRDYLKAKGVTASSEGLLRHEGMLHRSKLIANVPQFHLEKMLADPAQYAGKANAANVLRDFSEYLGGMKVRNPKTGKTGILPPDRHAELLAVKIERALAQNPGLKSFHETMPFGAQDKYINSSTRVVANADAVHEALKAAIGPGVRLKKAFDGIGMDSKKAMDWFGKTFGFSAKQLKKMEVDPSVVDAIVRSKKATSNPEWLGHLGEGIDTFLKMFKSNVTLPFPSFHIRNWISGQHMNVVSGHIKGARDLKKYLEAYKEAMSARHMGDANPEIQKALWHKVLDPFQAVEDVQLPGSNKLDTPMWDVKQSWQDAAENVKLNPQGTWPMGLDSRIPAQARQAMNMPAQVGGNIAKTAEYYNRMPMFLYLQKKGMSAADAAKEVEKLQFDYSRHTPFEKNVMKRMVPFYTFSRRITPQILEMLAERPGGGLAQSIRAGNAGTDDETVLPAHIAGTAALNLGTTQDGSQRYATGFGMAAEAALPYLMSPLDPSGSGLEALSAMNPLIKAPLEVATGQTFFQRGPTGGRPLNELDPSIGRTIANITGAEQPVDWMLGNRSATRTAEHVLANTPLTKYINTVRTLSDPRKRENYGAGAAMNLMTPVRVTDVSPQQQERLLNQASNALADELGAKQWKARYFPEDLIARAEKSDPQAAADMRALNKLWSEARRNAKKYQDQKKKPAPNEGERAVKALLKMAGV